MQTAARGLWRNDQPAEAGLRPPAVALDRRKSLARVLQLAMAMHMASSRQVSV
jgi:catechol-2,3-dioxygenase